MANVETGACAIREIRHRDDRVFNDFLLETLSREVKASYLIPESHTRELCRV